MLINCDINIEFLYFLNDSNKNKLNVWLYYPELYLSGYKIPTTESINNQTKCLFIEYMYKIHAESRNSLASTLLHQTYLYVINIYFR